jgi:stringent starvation protein B
MTESMPMTSHRPYLLRALYEWISDNGMTPHLLVDATRSGVQVPSQTVKDGKVVLNVAERAVSQFQMSNDVISFSARFGGVSFPVSVPVSSVLAIYARETGQGMALPDDGLADSDADEAVTGSDEPGVPLSAVPAEPSGDDDDDGPSRPSPRRSGHLRVVK